MAILSIGERAANILQSATLLQVAATYERCFYLRTGSHFVCVGDASLGDGPWNAVLSDYRQHVFERSPGETVWKARELLKFGDGKTLSWSAATRWTMPPWPAVSDWSLLPATLEMLLAASPTDGLFRQAVSLLLRNELPASTTLRTRAQAALADLVDGLVAVPPLQDTHLQTAARGLIGLGPGLTPSGDDVLAGALLGLHATGNAALAAQLGTHVAAASVGGTSPLSAAFLRCAIDGETSAHLHQAMSAALTNADWPAALDSLNRIGHTSGWDHLAGFLIALTAVQPRPVS
jgi:hypothetical protein